MQCSNKRDIVIIGWDGRSNSIYRFYDELSMPAHMRAQPTIPEILEKFPEAQYTNGKFQQVPLASLLKP